MTASRINKAIATLTADPRWFVKACRQQSGSIVFISESDASHSIALSGAELLDGIEATASLLLSVTKPQQRVLLFLPHGLEFIRSFLGCLYANAIAVPVPFMGTPSAGALASLAETAQADVLLTNTAGTQLLQTLPKLTHLRVVNIDTESAEPQTAVPKPASDDIAVLLFSSGSTAKPKGIVLSHGQLQAQASAGVMQWQLDRSSRVVSWLPQHHNFGLHFGLLAPLMAGASTLLFSPQCFVASPHRWIAAIHRHRGTHTAAPNFAFDLVCQHFDRTQIEELSLDCLQAIVCGGETVRRPTYERFMQMFRSFGLDSSVFCPHYGLSEVGAIVTSTPQPLRFIVLNKKSLQQGKAKLVRGKGLGISAVDCGKPLPGMQIRIVNPDSMQLCAADEVGEIWVQAPGVATGYWRQEGSSCETFGAAIKSEKDGRYLRTGDLGYVRNERLFIAGRRKDVIIVHGKNHYPNDIEVSIQERIPKLAPTRVAFSCELADAERVIVIQALDDDGKLIDYRSLAEELIAAVSESHGLELYDVCFVREQSVPKTVSGKVQRRACREAYEQQLLPMIYAHRAQLAVAALPPAMPAKGVATLAASGDILEVLARDVFGRELGKEVPVNLRSLSELGLNSIQCMRIAKRIEETFGVAFSPTLLFKYGRLDLVANYLSQCLGRVSNESALGSDQSTHETATAIAIIGMSGQFPAASNLQHFWENLVSEKDSIAALASANRPLLQAAYDESQQGTPFPPWGGFVDGIDEFDAAFFGIARIEAECMDPQQRKMLELVWHTFESAGYNPRAMEGSRVAVFAAVHNCDYAELVARIPDMARVYGAYLDSGLHMSMIANRVSRWFNFRGRSELINTACSSSLVAICHAVDALAKSDCELALVAGINLILSPRVYIASHQAGMLAPDGRCKTFDTGANGFVRAEGLGAVLLKPLQRAIADRDTICGVIRGAAVNHDGHSISLRAPNLEAQKELIKNVYRQANISPQTISYIEAHGTGTGLGDPIEVQALHEAFTELSPTLGMAYCGLGTVKTNIGHCESAAGIAGLLKVLLAMQHAVLPTNLHFKQLNARIDLKNSPFYVVHGKRQWNRLLDDQGNTLPRRAGVSSFGFGGSNAHVIVEEYCEPPVSPLVVRERPVLIVLSAKNEVRLQMQVRQLLQHTQPSSFSEVDLLDTAYTLQVGREAMDHRLAFIANTVADVNKKLNQYLKDKTKFGEMAECFQGTAASNREVLALFSGDDEADDLVNTWLAKGKYTKVLECWVKGLKVDWSRLYPAAKPKRIPLPTYPFLKERHWLQQSAIPLSGEKIGHTVGEIGLDVRASEVAASDSHSGTTTLHLLPSWDTVDMSAGAPWPAFDLRVLIVGGTIEKQLELQEHYPNASVLDCDLDAPLETLDRHLRVYGLIDHVVWLAVASEIYDVTDERLLTSQETGVFSLFRFIKALIKSGYEARAIGLTVVTWQTQQVCTGERIDSTHASIHGLVGSLAKEYSHWKVRLIDLPFGRDWPLGELLRVPANERGDACAYRHGEWYGQQLIPCAFDVQKNSQYRSGGVYVVIGGAGGLGEVFSEYLIRNYHAQVVWIGRRAIDSLIQSKIDRLSALGPAPRYLCADATNREALERAYRTAKSEYGPIHGVVHAAIALLDKSIAQMDEERFAAGVVAKVAVSVRLAQVFSSEALECVLFFSSMQSFGKAAGQSNYSAGCTFKDAYARSLAQAWACPVKVINWGYWGSAGVVATQKYQKRMMQLGIASIEAPRAMQALETLLGTGVDQLAFLQLTNPESFTEAASGEQVELLSQTIPVVNSDHLIRCAALVSHDDAYAVTSGDEHRQFDGWLAKLLLTQLQSIGGENDYRSAVRGAAVHEQERGEKIADRYERWLVESLRVLAERGLPQERNAELANFDTTNQDPDTVWAMWREQKQRWLSDPQLRAQVNLADATMRALPEILLGNKLATDVLFPNASIETVKDVYKNNSVSDYYNEVLAASLAGYVRERLRIDPAARVRILEIGAGTGGTTAVVLSALKPYASQIEEYCFTDISKAFLLHAEDQYGRENPCLTYALFNVEQPLAGQAIKVGRYDIVVATNVLHATKNIRSALRNAKAALRTNGVLFLNEINQFNLFAHQTFGLLDGWWLYEDSLLRVPGTPALSPATWLRLLTSEGFSDVLNLTQTAPDMGQQVIVAQSNGAVRQCVSMPMNLASPASAVAQKLAQRQLADTHTTVTTSGSTQDSRHIENYIRELIVASLSASLRVAASFIEEDQAFADFGVDSILGIKTIQEINQTLGIELNTTTLFDYGSVSRLTNFLIAQHGPAIAAVLSSKSQSVAAVSPANTQPLTLHSSNELTATGVPHPHRNTDVAMTNLQVAEQHSHLAPIAIIGMSGRFAGADDIDALWELLSAGRDAVTEVSRWRRSDYAGDSDASEQICSYGGFLSDIESFDPMFFNISGIEATFMDPQQRLFLEESWKALEDAGCVASELDGARCGVYTGCNGNDYSQLFAKQGPAQSMWGNSSSVVSARIAYYLNLQGPAITVDTACSSSLVAIHLACQGLWNEETDLAIGGGVFVQCTPDFYLQAHRAGMLSPTGRCYTFDERANGFVPGEGVGALVLKRLKDALQADDRIHGVIRGSGINQDGATNGITAPSALSQERLQREVYERFAIHPEEIQIVEAHGTGTSLGDPIEYQALSRAFRKSTDKQHYCAIGSIKTNIGHTAAASGVAGLIKILLALKHKQLPPSLHYEQGNSRIEFANSPFYVNTALRPWEVSSGRKRCAAVSAFGFSGTNAHMVIEEPPQVDRCRAPRPGYLIALSAHTAEQLTQQATRLVAYCMRHSDMDCGDISYTLLIGRKHYRCRVAVVAKDCSELAALLQAWINTGKGAQVYVPGADVRDRHSSESLRVSGERLLLECKQFTEPSVYVDKLATLASLYIQGCRLEYRRLFTDSACTIVSLPAYSFARERYWVEPRVIVATPKAGAAAAALHPLLHTNTSDLSGLKFSSTFSGDEFFLADHIIGGHRVLPGVCYLEMARAALCASTLKESSRERMSVVLRNVVWSKLVVVDEPKSLYTRLYRQESGEIEYAIYSEPGKDANGMESERVVHSQGLANWLQLDDVEQVDVAGLRTQCDVTFDRAACYAAFKSLGFEHGPAHQALEWVGVGSDVQGHRYVLAEIKLPECVRETRDAYELHPSVLDCALQASMGFSLGEELGITSAVVPFAVDELQILARSPSLSMVVVRERPGKHRDSRLQKLDIDLCDELGRVCVRCKGFSSRALDAGVGEARSDTVLLKRNWMAVTNQSADEWHGKRWLVLDAFYESSVAAIQSHFPQLNIVLLAPATKDVVLDLTALTRSVFSCVQSILNDAPKEAVLVQVVLVVEPAEQVTDSLLSAVSGLLKSAHKEHPKLFGQVIQAGVNLDSEELIRCVHDSATAAGVDEEIRYLEGVREVSTFTELAKPVGYSPSLSAWRDRGVYLITGGAGGLGLIVAEDIACKVHGATIVLAGRATLSTEKQTTLALLKERYPGSHFDYRTMDVTDALVVRQVVHAVVEQFGALNGLIHSAGVIHDNFIIKKSATEFAHVLAPKVIGTYNLDQATQDVALDCFIVFSSIAAVFGNVGQSDYAVGNAFLDRYASHRAALVKQGKRTGKTLSINWPLWANGGMQIDAISHEQMERQGIYAIGNDAGMNAFHAAYASAESQVAVFNGKRTALATLLCADLPQPATEPRANAVTTAGPNPSLELPDSQSAGSKWLRENTVRYIKKLLASTFQLSPDRIDADAALEQYGMDSILALQLVSVLEGAFGSLAKTLFFEYRNIDALAEYFIEQHRDRLLSQLPAALSTATATARAISPISQVAGAVVTPAKRVDPLPLRSHREEFASRSAVPHVDKEPEHSAFDIAIIGLSGRYPQANTLDQFWENLKAGKDCITEIPEQRWSQHNFFDLEKGKAGRSYSKWGGFIDGVDQFDPLFFNISPREAHGMDPQERLFLQCVFQTLEDAGYTRETCKRYSASGLDGNVGVFVGVMYEEYQLFGAQAQAVGQPYALSGSASSIANRVSYFCDFRGPSVAFDTMCSSSLTAIHFACQSIRNGGCELAVAGGVNVSVHPNKYLLLSHWGFLASDGRCESFGKGGDGYVPGEGVGAVLLKPVERAKADGDHIYGVIKGTSINHGGKTNGYAVPNPHAQAQVIAGALKIAAIDARTISYIEAHGTGTSLGDPIEIAGLVRAFNGHTQDRQFCAIGSAKSNVGHLESAAGIAGLTKVLLQMRYRTLVPSLHAEVLNPQIDFASSPFAVQRTLGEWRRPKLIIDGKEREYPRRAGISSFGAGGSNAHLIVEEYVESEIASGSIDFTPERPALVVLSARNEERLQERAAQLLEHLDGQRNANVDLADLAFTLQVGREAMDHRLAFTVTTMGELQAKLGGFLAGHAERDDGEGCYLGDVKKNKEALSIFNTDEALQLVVGSWIERGKYDKLLELWVKGLSFDWLQLYTTVQPKRISLPAYPFAQDRYWIDTNKLSQARASAGQALHPLLHANTSDLTEQKFTSTFSGDELFLVDQIAHGKKMLPGVCYLEMARAAVERSANSDRTGVLSLKNVVWLQPLMVTGVQEVHIALSRRQDGEIEYEVYTADQENASAEAITHAHGRAAWQIASTAAESLLLLEDLRGQCERTIDVAEIYAAYGAIGMEYGLAHRGLTSVRIGTDGAGRQFVLAHVKLPECVCKNQNEYVLHPSVLDSALQASLALSLDICGMRSAENNNAAVSKALLPFSLEQLEIIDRTPQAACVVVRPARTGSLSDAYIQQVDIEICDESGRVCVRMLGVASHTRVGGLVAHRSSNDVVLTKSETTTALCTSDWVRAIPSVKSSEAENVDRVVVLSPIYKECEFSLRERYAGAKAHIEYLHERESALGAPGFMMVAWQIFAQVQEILRGRPQRRVLLQVVIGAGAADSEFTFALSGLLKSAHQENSKFMGQVICLSATANVAELIRALDENASTGSSEAEIRYVDGMREVKRLKELRAADSVQPPVLPWKTGGVYVITGGMGALGLIFASEIAKHASRVTIVLTGRSVLSDAQQSRLQSLQASYPGAFIHYRTLDVVDAAAVTKMVHAVVEQYGELSGIVHSAGAIKDGFVIKKTAEEFRSVLGPKIQGTINLDQATQEMQLDCFIMFSSLAAVLGNVGQSDYAMANAFMDGYAGYRTELVKRGKRTGKTLAINWPLWADGGMRIDATLLVQMRRQGWDTLVTTSGIDAFYRAWASAESQVIVLSGERTRIAEQVANLSAIIDTPVTTATAEGVRFDTDIDLLKRVRNALAEQVAEQLQMKIADVDAEAELGEFGFESLSMTVFSNNINHEYGLQISPTIFFEHPTLRSFAEYLVAEFSEQLAAKWAVRATKVAVQTQAEPSLSGKSSNRLVAARSVGARRPRSINLDKQARIPATEPIAIIGMSGCFPGANDIDDFWEILRSGKDCIAEIPASRWDWRAMFGDPQSDTNKTNIKWGGFIAGADEFDPLFFGISPREALLMDPQQRLLMTYIWKVIEDAGYAAQNLSGSQTGIFVGTTNSGYSELITQANLPIEGYTSTGSVPSVGPNRMSYLLNLHGPSEPIETACSSSLVAIHRAVRAMQSGDCDMALVGGINTIFTPWGHISLNKAGMLSEDGRCKTFSKDANGYVRGEGVGMLFLKRLAFAERDGDHIYGVIKGSSENHGGRANSLTAPNPLAQAALIKAAYREAQIDPRSVSYIETHGTGTPLGDPIEINGLKSAFSDLYKDPQWSEASTAAARCGLGSVKTNIGHLELAAGVAGVIKVLLQLQHRTLVKSLHCEDLNPYIQLTGSPFYVVSETQPWPTQSDHQGRVLPRRAGISSFGFGGVNAHVVVEEYASRPLATPLTADHPGLIVLSAKSEAQLQEQARRLQSHLTTHAFTDMDMVNVAYTLQVGREAMEHRLAFTATTMSELLARLAAYADGSLEPDTCHRGEVKKHRESISLFGTDAELQEAIGKWLARGKYDQLLNLWVKGLAFDWRTLYGEHAVYRAQPCRISLPTYPFAKDRYWCAADSVARTDVNLLHPLLHRNTSNLNVQQFSSSFSGDEFFLADHIVKGKKVLPGVCHLEMARAAIEASLGDVWDAESNIELKNVVWLRPVVVAERTALHVFVYPQSGDEIKFEIRAAKRDFAADEFAVYATGQAVHSKSIDMSIRLDVTALRQEKLQTISTSDCYAAFAAMRIEYGAGFRGLATVQAGSQEDGESIVIARITLPACVMETQDQYVLHPSILDSALQAAIGLSIADRAQDLNIEATKSALPFSLERLRVIRKPPNVAWVVVRPSAASGNTDAGAGKLRKLDIDVCDEEGRACVRLMGFSSRIVEDELPDTPTENVHRARGKGSADSAHTEGETHSMFLAPSWEVLIPAAAMWPASDSSVLVVGGTKSQLDAWRTLYPQLTALSLESAMSADTVAKRIRAIGTIDHLVWHSPQAATDASIDDTIIQAQSVGVIGLFLLTKALFSLGYAMRPFELTVITSQTQAVHSGDPIDATHASVHGFIGSLAKEHEDWRIRLVDLPAETTAEELPLAELVRVPADSQGTSIAYRAGEWYRQALMPCDVALSPGQQYRHGGVYVIVGGAGGIGEAFSEYLIRHYQARLIWIGRRDLNAEIRAKVERLALLGQAPLYLRADAGDRDALEKVYQTIKETHGQIHGVVHAAIALLDKSLVQMDEIRFKASLATKVDVSVRMAQVFAAETLDFVLFFSSLQSFARSAGQSNYAAGCTFTDAFAQQLAKVWLCPVKVMNWGYWGSVGVVASSAYRERMAQQGIRSIESAEGMAALEKLLASSAPQLAFLIAAQQQLPSIVSPSDAHLTLLDSRLPSLSQFLSPSTSRILELAEYNEHD